MENALAAQYLRVSTERQEYSLGFQSARIANYAQQNNFAVCRTYIDEAKSGLDLRRRNGLIQLLCEVLAGHQPYKAILVYDVSRWGRFQDPDEAATYEFLCKTAGVRVHYCAENFSNDGHLPDIILKTLKRIMAGEYSRELSEKVFAGLSRAAQAGFRTGGRPGYGFRRMLISADKTPKGELAAGEYKSLSNERVRLVPGSEREAHWIREIYRMFIAEKRTLQAIADELNRLQVPYVDGHKWMDHSVRRILTNPKYQGTAVYNRRSSKLRSKQKSNPETDWIIVPGAIPAIVDPETFEAAQQIFRSRPWNLSNDKVLETLRHILEAKGRLSASLLQGVPNVVNKDACKRRFGSLVRAFELAGYESPQKSKVVCRQQVREVRVQVMEDIVQLFPGEVSIQKRGPVHRNCLRLKRGTRVAVRACRCVINKYKSPTWILQPARRDKRLVTLLIALNSKNTAPDFLFMLPPISNRCQVAFSRTQSWFKHGIRLEDLSSFCDAVRQMRGQSVLGGGRRLKGWYSDDARAAVREALRARWAATGRS